MNGLAKYKKYESYIDSGVDWIGEIPKEWGLVKLRFLCSVTTGNKDTVHRVDEGDYPFFVRSKNIERINTYSYDGEAILTAGDGDIGKIFHYIQGKFDFHQRVYKFSEFKNILGKYFFYYISENFSKHLERYSAKTTVDSLRLPMIQEFIFTVPTFSEQKKVIIFLDRETTKLDGLISKKQRLIELLKEKRQALITHAVTKGLDPNAKMKNSGIEWIGEIPEGWAVKRLKNLKKGNFLYGANESAELDDVNSPRFIRITDIDEDGKLKDETFKSLPYEKAKSYSLKDGDILFARSGATVGKAFIFDSIFGDACFAGYLIRFRANLNLVIPKFIRYFTQTSNYWNAIRMETIQATIQNFSAEKYGEILVVLPTLSEQTKIVDFLNLETLKFESLIEKLNTQITKIQEYRQALITAAVTGKIDVRDEVTLSQEREGKPLE